MAESVAQLRRLVRHRAADRCEYCLISAAVDEAPFHVEHVVPRQHGGGTVLDNLALACPWCNGHKGPNLAGVDAPTDAIERLFHPRQDRWQDHFSLVIDGAVIGLSATGRVTVTVLAMNAARRRQLRLLSNP